MLRILGLCYGDSGIFIRRDIYHRIGGFRALALFEDLDLLRRLRRAGRFVHLPAKIRTSSRRFEQRNFALVWLHWTALQVLYWCGISPNRLARWYRHVRRNTAINITLRARRQAHEGCEGAQGLTLAVSRNGSDSTLPNS